MSSPFFRSPLDETSSTCDTTSSGSENDLYEASDSAPEASKGLDAPKNVYDLARTRSAASTSIEELSRSLPNNYVGGQVFDHKDGVIHALLERTCLYEALEELNNTLEPERGRLYTKDDPEVKARARAKYLNVASSLAATGITNSDLHRDEYKPLRENYNQALDVVKDRGEHALGHLRKKTPTTNMYRSNSALELSHVANNIDETSPSQRSPIRYGPLPPPNQPDFLKGNHHPFFAQSSSITSFYNLQVIGKGGYGTVFSGHNPLDGGSYAIKQIPLSAARIRNIQNKGSAELDSLLREVRAMQGFDHPNIVRYHNAWLERPSDELHRRVKANQKLLEFGSTNFSTDMGSSEAPATTSGHDQTFASRWDHSEGIVFGEDSMPGQTAHSDYHSKIPRKRRESRLTSSSLAKSDQQESDFGEPAELLASSKQALQRKESHTTLSSSVSKKSFVHSAEYELDEDIETIPRDFHNLALSGPRENSFDMDIVFEDDCPAPQRQPDVRTPRSTDVAQISMALHIQMALYPMTLTDYLKAEPGAHEDEAKYRHCFHVKPSLQILLAILDGVQYLHARNMVHRDLKPANIFLSPCEEHYRHKGHVHIGICRDCSKTGSCKDIQLGVRIGDFGLVTELARLEGDQHHGPEKAVGTEFYRPPIPPRRPSEKLDVFSLGVIAFELLWKFDTSESPSPSQRLA